jgi:hypothetical protein
MPHNSSNYVVTHFLPRAGANPAAVGLTHIEAAELERILTEDARDYLYTGTVSMASAFSNLERNLFSWATIELYYSNFYFLRAFLALSKVCIFYDGSKPRILSATSGSTIQIPRGTRNATTHGLVLEQSKTVLAAKIFLSQDIDGANPLDWLREKREDINYKHSKFPEPQPPAFLSVCLSHSLRKLVTSYVNDLTLYAFDKDHAVIAFTLLVWDHLISEMKAIAKFDFSGDDLNYLSSLFKDQTGALSALTNRLRT